MQTFAMLTRLEPNGLQSPTAVEDLEHRVMEHIQRTCPTAHWIASYAVTGPYDYLDLFRADDIDQASKISAIVRSFGHAHTEVWPLTEWQHFKSVIHEIGLVRA
jgi:muconolactone delta-isomerase